MLHKSTIIAFFFLYTTKVIEMTTGNLKNLCYLRYNLTSLGMQEVTNKFKAYLFSTKHLHETFVT